MPDNLILNFHDDYEEYLRDESRTIGQADSISFPKTEDEIKAILIECNEKFIPVTIQGARTGLAAAAVPMGGHIMNLSRMNAVTGCREDDAGIFYLTVQPGVVLSQLRKGISERKFDTSSWSSESRKAWENFQRAPEQFFTPDPTETSATIGGMVNCNASGARSYLYGATRGYVSALRVVLMDGRVIALRRGDVFADGETLSIPTINGAPVNIALPHYPMPETKNTSGYFSKPNMDAIDLLIGSDGTLGVITSIEIALRPLPQVIMGVVSFFHREEDAITFVYKIREAVTQIASVEFFDGDALEILRKQKANHSAFSQLPEIEPWIQSAIYTELHCDTEEDALEHMFAIGEILTQCGSTEEDSWVARNQADIDKMLFFRHAVPESVNMLIDERKKKDSAITKLGSDMAVPNEYLSKIMKMYHADMEERGLQSAVWGHIGDNHVHVNILPNSREEYESGKDLFRNWAKEVTRLGGAVSAEHGVGKLKKDFLTIMMGEEVIQEMKEVKRAFDAKFLLGRHTMFEPLEGGKI